MDNKTILTFEELCSYLHIGRNNGYALLASGQIKACKIGRKWIIEKGEIEKFLEQKKKMHI